MDFAFLPSTDRFLHPLIHRHSLLGEERARSLSKGEQTIILSERGYVKQFSGQTAGTGPRSEL